MNLIPADKEKVRARNRLHEAVRSGKMLKPEHCSRCQRKLAKKLIHGHHHQGYQNALDVIWVCMPCHDELEPKAKGHPGDSNPMRRYPEITRKGSKNNFAKLSERDVLEIRKLGRERLITRKAIAAQFNITEIYLYEILARRKWRHL